MDGIHDMGGMEGFGPVVVEADEPVFHERWEGRALGLLFLASSVLRPAPGQFRHGIERMDAVHYLTSSYYEHWLTGLATLLVEKGHATADDLAQRAGGGFPLSHPEANDQPSDPAGGAFGLGDTVTVTTRSPRHHTRCPRYVRGKTGTVVRIDPAFSLPDDPARTEAIYSIRFEAEELWGTGPGDPVFVDLWESYLR